MPITDIAKTTYEIWVYDIRQPIADANVDPRWILMYTAFDEAVANQMAGEYAAGGYERVVVLRCDRKRVSDSRSMDFYQLPQPNRTPGINNNEDH